MQSTILKAFFTSLCVSQFAFADNTSFLCTEILSVENAKDNEYFRVVVSDDWQYAYAFNPFNTERKFGNALLCNGPRMTNLDFKCRDFDLLMPGFSIETIFLWDTKNTMTLVSELNIDEIHVEVSYICEADFQSKQ